MKIQKERERKDIERERERENINRGEKSGETIQWVDRTTYSKMAPSCCGNCVAHQRVKTRRFGGRPISSVGVSVSVWVCGYAGDV